MTTKCQCDECNCKEMLMAKDKDGKYLCASCRLGKHGHRV